MSETRDLNSAGESPPDPERLLRELAPLPLEISRDDLFYRAGLAAGGRQSGMSLAWPSVAAALLLVSIALGTALVQQQFTPGSGTAAGPQGSAVASLPSSAPAANFSSDFLQLNPPALLSPRKLTAVGWIEFSSASGNFPRDSNSDASNEPAPAENRDSMSPRNPPTYFELLRKYRET